MNIKSENKTTHALVSSAHFVTDFVNTGRCCKRRTYSCSALLKMFPSLASLLTLILWYFYMSLPTEKQLSRQTHTRTQKYWFSVKLPPCSISQYLVNFEIVCAVMSDQRGDRQPRKLWSVRSEGGVQEFREIWEMCDGNTSHGRFTEKGRCVSACGIYHTVVSTWWETLKFIMIISDRIYNQYCSATESDLYRAPFFFSL